MMCLKVLFLLALTTFSAIATDSQKLLHDHLPGKHATKSRLAQWEDCGNINDHKLECARIDVPANHFNRSKSGECYLPSS